MSTFSVRKKCTEVLKTEELTPLTSVLVGKLELPLKEAPSQYLTNTRFQL